MGMIICKKHGKRLVGMNIQQEICEKLLKNDPLKDDDLSVIKMLYYDDDKLLLHMSYLVTKALKKQLRLRDVYHIKDDFEDEQPRKLLELRMSAICNQCLDEYEYKDDIQNTLAEHRIYLDI